MQATNDTSTGDDKTKPPRRRAGRPENRLAIRLLQSVGVCFARIYHRLEVRNRFPLPHDGAAIVICNHTSGLDPILIQSVSPRIIRWMMAKEFYDLRAMNWMFRTIEAIPVARAGRDMAATRAALRVLEKGEVLGVFPEGRIEKTRELLPFQGGIALIAIKTGAPVYPAFLDGTQRNKSMLRAFLLPNRAVLAFGPPVAFDRSGTDKDTLAAATKAIQDAVQGLMDRTRLSNGKS